MQDEEPRRRQIQTLSEYMSCIEFVDFTSEVLMILSSRDMCFVFPWRGDIEVHVF